MRPLPPTPAHGNHRGVIAERGALRSARVGPARARGLEAGAGMTLTLCPWCSLELSDHAPGMCPVVRFRASERRRQAAEAERLLRAAREGSQLPLFPGEGRR